MAVDLILEGNPRRSVELHPNIEFNFKAIWVSFRSKVLSSWSNQTWWEVASETCESWMILLRSTNIIFVVIAASSSVSYGLWAMYSIPQLLWGNYTADLIVSLHTTLSVFLSCVQDC